MSGAMEELEHFNEQMQVWHMKLAAVEKARMRKVAGFEDVYHCRLAQLQMSFQ
jgi:hypothetical protein